MLTQFPEQSPREFIRVLFDVDFTFVLFLILQTGGMLKMQEKINQEESKKKGKKT